MASNPRILLLDDDQELLDMYKEILSQLSSQPEVITASSGARAIALLETQKFRLLVTDLNMPKMDGLQVLSIVRRKYPQLRIVVLTSVMDEQFRSRSYAMGVDLFWQKPSTMDEIKLFLDCIESLLDRDVQEQGFRGVQSKSLVDLIQLECLSRTSTTLRIINGKLEGKIWIRDGDIIDASTGLLSDTAAFKEILCWKTGSFEILPADDSHPRKIQESYQGLLLETAQAIDEGQYTPSPGANSGEGDTIFITTNRLLELTQVPGIEFLVDVPEDRSKNPESWAAENVTVTAAWIQDTVDRFRKLGDEMQAGQLVSLLFPSQQTHLTCSPGTKSHLLAGWNHGLPVEELRDKAKALTAKWAS